MIPINDHKVIVFLDWLLREINQDYSRQNTLNALNKKIKDHSINKNLYKQKPSERLPDNCIQFMIGNTNHIFRDKDEDLLTQDLLDWLEENGEKLYDILKMPDLVFNDYIDKYCAGRSDRDLINLTIWHQNYDCRQYLAELINKAGYDNSEELNKLIKQYVIRHSRYKCFFLFDYINSDIYEKLIHDHWKDLNFLSREYLDIYYSEDDLKKSGFEIADEIDSLPSELRFCVPGIIIWKDNISAAKSISLDYLDDQDVCRVIKKIVRCISLDLSFEMIVEEANMESKNLDDRKMGNISINAYNSTVRDVIHNGHTINSGDTNSFVTSTSSGNGASIVGNNNQYNKDVADAFEQVLNLLNNNNSNTDEELKKELIAAINEAKDAILTGDDKKKESIGQKIKSICVQCSAFAPILLQNLAALTQIADYFGYNPFV